MNFESPSFKLFPLISKTIIIDKVEQRISWLVDGQKLDVRFKELDLFILKACIDHLKEKLPAAKQALLAKQAAISQKRKDKKETPEEHAARLWSAAMALPDEDSVPQDVSDTASEQATRSSVKDIARPSAPEFEPVTSFDDVSLERANAQLDNLNNRGGVTGTLLPKRLQPKAKTVEREVMLIVHRALNGVGVYLASYLPALLSKHEKQSIHGLRAINVFTSPVNGHGFSIHQKPHKAFTAFIGSQKLYGYEEDDDRDEYFSEAADRHIVRMSRLGADFEIKSLTGSSGRQYHGVTMADWRTVDDLFEAMEYASNNDVLYTAYVERNELHVRPLKLVVKSTPTFEWEVFESGGRGLKKFESANFSGTSKNVLNNATLFELDTGYAPYARAALSKDERDGTFTPEYEVRLTALEAQALRQKMLADRAASPVAADDASANIAAIEAQIPLPKEIPVFRKKIMAEPELSFRSSTQNGVKYPTLQVAYSVPGDKNATVGTNINSSPSKISILDVMPAPIPVEMQSLLDQDLGSRTTLRDGAIKIIGHDPSKFDQWTEVYKKSKQNAVDSGKRLSVVNFPLSSEKVLDIDVDGKADTGGDIVISVAIKVNGKEVAMAALVKALGNYTLENLQALKSEGKKYVWASLEAEAWLKVPLESAISIFTLIREYKETGLVEVSGRTFRVNRFDIGLLGKVTDLAWATGLEDVRKKITLIQDFDWQSASPQGLTKEEIACLKP